MLKPKEQVCHSVAEVLKSLICQALTIDSVSRTDLKLSFQMRQFLDAQLDKDYANLLGSLLERFRLVYITVEARALDGYSAIQCWDYLQEISRRLSGRKAATIVKVVFLSYGPDTRNLQKMVSC